MYRPTYNSSNVSTANSKLDLNAARNITMDNIEEIIRKQIKVQKQQEEQARNTMTKKLLFK